MGVPKSGNIKTHLASILFWSVISAAFIGPGTVTTATKAGADFQFQLLWALTFSTFACVILQEATARVTIYSGKHLGEAISKHFEGKSTKGLILFLVFVAIILGCAAYETGNILGSIEGLALIFPEIDKRIFVAIVGILAALALSLKSMKAIANFMGSLVFIMGIAFFTTAVYTMPSIPEVLKGAFIPSMPNLPGAGLLVLGLVGTTVVPYDLFLGSSVIEKEQTIKEMRIGVSVAIILGGIISMAILAVGTEMTRGLSENAVRNLPFSYKLLEETLVLHIGQWAVYIFGIGMFAAGFSSAITAPLASALTAKSLFYKRKTNTNNEYWKYFRLTAFGVLSVGLFFGFLQIKPVPAIIMAQAFNGLILPFVSVFLIFVINSKQVMGEKYINGHLHNALMGVVVWVTLIIGISNIISAFTKIFSYKIQNPDVVLILNVSVSFLITAYIYFLVYKKRASDKKSDTNLIAV